jgi:hypothetical protein
MSTTPVISGFPIDGQVTLRKRGDHMDVGFEVSNHNRQEDSYGEPRGTWCYYVTIMEYMISPDAFDDFWLPPGDPYFKGSGIFVPVYNYTSGKFADAGWHCGITYYEKIGGLDGAPRGVKMGCDYNHYWDEGQHFHYSEIETDAKLTIDAFRRMYEFKRRCSWSGKWLPESELTADDKGRLFHAATKAEVKE